MLSDAQLRARVFAIDNYRCPWPECGQPAVELAHITSKGLGGSKHRNTEGNAFAACRAHARISDGLPPPGGTFDDRDDEYGKVPGWVGYAFVAPRTRDVLEALRAYLVVARGLTPDP